MPGKETTDENERHKSAHVQDDGRVCADDQTYFIEKRGDVEDDPHAGCLGHHESCLRGQHATR